MPGNCPRNRGPRPGRAAMVADPGRYGDHTAAFHHSSGRCRTRRSHCPLDRHLDRRRGQRRVPEQPRVRRAHRVAELLVLEQRGRTPRLALPDRGTTKPGHRAAVRRGRSDSSEENRTMPRPHSNGLERLCLSSVHGNSAQRARTDPRRRVRSPPENARSATTTRVLSTQHCQRGDSIQQETEFRTAAPNFRHVCGSSSASIWKPGFRRGGTRPRL